MEGRHGYSVHRTYLKEPYTEQDDMLFGFDIRITDKPFLRRTDISVSDVDINDKSKYHVYIPFHCTVYNRYLGKYRWDDPKRREVECEAVLPDVFYYRYYGLVPREYDAKTRKDANEDDREWMREIIRLLDTCEYKEPKTVAKLYANIALYYKIDSLSLGLWKTGDEYMSAFESTSINFPVRKNQLGKDSQGLKEAIRECVIKKLKIDLDDFKPGESMDVKIDTIAEKVNEYRGVA